MRVTVAVVWVVVFVGCTCGGPSGADGGAGGAAGGASAGGASGGGTSAGGDAGGSTGGGTAGGAAGGMASRPPMAVIANLTTATVGDVVVVDGSGSVDPDGDALVHSWEFGDGVRANGVTAAHVFTTPGTFTVTLTVRDATGAVGTATRPLTINARPSAGSPIAVTVTVKDTLGALQASTLISVVGSSTTATTSVAGVATLMLPRGVPQTLRFTKAGFSTKLSVLTLLSSQTSGHLDVVLRARQPAVQIDATTGGRVTGLNGVVLDLPPGAVVDAAGAPVSGMIEVSLTPVNVVQNADAFPGLFQGISPQGTRGSLASYGTTEFVLSRQGTSLNLAPGRTAVIELPMDADQHLPSGMVAVGSRIPLWSLDERSGLWVQEGDGEVVASAATTGLSLRATVGHFSWWNVDKFSQPQSNPRPSCCIDGDADGRCDANGNPEYCWLRGTTNCPSAFGCRAAPTIPTTMADVIIPGIGGVELPVPANVAVYLVADAPNGTHRGVLLYNGLPNAVDQPVILLTATGVDGGATTVSSFPFSTTGAFATPADSHVYRVVAQQNDFLSIATTRANTSTLQGTVRLSGPNGFVHDQVAFGYGGTVSRGGAINAKLPFAGEWLVTVRPTSGLPSTYTLTLGNVPTGVWVEELSPAFGANDVPLDAGLFVRFSGSLAGTPAASNTSALLLGGVNETGTTRTVSTDRLSLTQPQPLNQDTNYQLALVGAQSLNGMGIIVGVGADGGSADWAGRILVPFRTQRVPGLPSAIERDAAGRRAGVLLDDGQRLFAYGDAKVATYSIDAGWSAPTALGSGTAWQPCLVSRGGRALLAISQNGSVLTSWWRDGARFSAPTVVGNNATLDVIGCATSGSEGLLGRRATGEVWLSSSPGDGGWVDGLAVSDAGSIQSPVLVAMNATGAGAAVWQRLGSDGGWVVDTARWSGSSWTVDLQTAIGSTSMQDPNVGVASSGEVVVSWFEGRAPIGYRAVVWEPDAGSWTSPSTVIAATSFPTGCTNTTVQVVPNVAGVTVIGCAQTAAGLQVLSRTYSNGGWGTTEVVGTMGAPLLSSTSEGSAIVFWAGSSTSRVFVNGSWQTAFTVTGTPLNGTTPVVSPRGHSGFFFADVNGRQVFLDGP